MSVNITVNGNFVTKHCQKNPLLLDREKAKKELEEERRKKRLLQVRQQSKQIAEKIRNDVKETKRKELQKYEATKAQEFEAWRKEALQQNKNECNEAIFQLGAAHKAAKAENQARAEKQAAATATKPQGSYKEFRKQMEARRNKNENLQKEKPAPTTTVSSSKGQSCSECQYKCKCYTRGQEEAQKRKRDSCLFSSDSETLGSDEETSNEETLKDTPSLTSLSPCKTPTTTTTFSNNIATQTSIIKPEKNLKQTPAVYMDVEVGTDDSVLIAGPVEIKDKHAEYNRQFSSVIRVSPNNKKVTSISTTTTSTTEDKENSNDCNKNISIPPSKTKEKRFTLISNLVKKQEEQPKNSKGISPSKKRTTEVQQHSSPRKFIAMPAPLTRPPVAPPMSKAMPPQKESISSKVTSRGHQLTQPTTTTKSISTASANTVAMGSLTSSCGRVQFYDYNSKLSKEGTQNSANVEVIQQRDTVQPTAMEQAAVENRLQYDRQQDMLDKQKQMMERGQKALEREQVRRDCNDLTEKLEALTKQYPRQVPINVSLILEIYVLRIQNHSLFVDKQLRLEGKMNSAVEKLLSRPQIITCSEMDESVKKPQQAAAVNKPKINNEINVGAFNSSNDHQAYDDVASDSCCSILLGYVDDQSRQVRKDLEQWSDKEDSQKQKRLKNLLQRLDKLRHSIMQEIQNNKTNKKDKSKSPTTKSDDNYRQLIEDISTFRQERENIMLDGIEIRKEKSSTCKEKQITKECDENKQTKKHCDKKLLAEREKLLEQKEAILEEKLREFYELQKQNNKTPKPKMETKPSQSPTEKIAKGDDDKNKENKENINCSSLETPVEIIITVQGETKCVKIPLKNNKKKTGHKKPSPTHLATLIKSPHAKVSNKKLTPKKVIPSKESTTKPVPPLVRHNSYDSNSTSYMSLPSQIPTQLGTLVDRTTQKQMLQYNSAMETSTETDVDDGREVNKKPVPHINPLVAQYVQRLLGMSRKTIQRLAVSSSDIETPSSSIINTSGNNSPSNSLLSDERMAFVESFVQENRSFIKELEQSMRAQSNASLEDSMKAFDDIWRKRLKQKQQNSKFNKPLDQRKNHQGDFKKLKTASSPKAVRCQKKETSKEEIQSKEISSQSKHNEKQHSMPKGITKLANKYPVNLEHSTGETESSPEMLEKLKAKSKQRLSTKVDKAVETKLSQDHNKSESDSQIARYAQLTENCTHRIAELTELINRVREEKQRLLEVTLSSVSDNGRQSTEYLELPEGKSRTSNHNEGESSMASSTEEVTATTAKSAPTLGDKNQPLQLSNVDKNHPIAASRDSGIAESRPITAQELRLDLEPISQTSTTESHGATQHRKTKPPPTLRRFSPQFREEDLVHELSTILEVDTPANSRINTAASQKSEEQITVAREMETSQQNHEPVKFPTFEEYVQRMNLDITQLDTEQSSLLKAEFSHFLEDMQRSRLNGNKHPSPPQYNEFPSINGYLNQTKPEITDQTELMEDSLAQLRINDLKPKTFPPVREYVKQKYKENANDGGSNAHSPDDPQMLLDTESLENITDIVTNTESESASLDIEKELKQRKILKHSFRYTKPKEIFSSTAHHDVGEFYQELMGCESGIERLSTSETTTTQLETDLKRMVNQWSKENKDKPQQYQSLSSTTTSSSAVEKLAKSTSLDESSNENGRPLNLRDFLKRELLKHPNFSTSSSTTSSIDDSLRSQFLHSLIGSLTPRTNAATSKSGQHTLDRQKTSTPVPGHSSQTRSTPGTGENPLNTTSSQLFSGESHISSVHGCDRSKNAARSNVSESGNQSSE
ncbi:uncharacterized protein LOC133336112 [Musca vetustissima]|uniref:uncharacterized protein LOC133336112 n=1 Tax=Musca vetustissima TaxID=27455 RepID=UPI002AB7BAB1|nr:uncharacterized protein LOC133336112 [Musca vetustissima]